MTDWQNIDSAPRDGTVIMGCKRGRPGMRVRWASADGVEGWFTDDDVHVGRLTWWKPETVA